MARPADPDLQVVLEHPVERRIPAGFLGAVFCFGHCFHRHQGVVGLELLIDGRRHRPSALGMPRRDLYAWLRSEESDLEGRSYRSGFWATLPVRAGSEAGFIELEAAVRLADGAEIRRPLARLEVVARDALAPAAAVVTADAVVPTDAVTPARAVPAGPDTIAICLATFEPDIELLRSQLESIRGQSDERWVCLISDGGSSPERLAALRALTEGDERFLVSAAEERLDPYRNFERALRMVPAGVELIALSDQDDRWYPDKLETLYRSLGDAELVYSDLRLVTAEGQVLRESLWEGRRNDHRNLASLLVANSMPGAAMLMRRQVVERALPFPRLPAVQYHDHWLALVALASGEVRYVDRPLYDWVQHSAATSRGAGAATVAWRGAYFGGVVPRQAQALTLLMRCRDSLTPAKRRALRWFLACERSPLAFLWLAVRPLRALVGRGETLGSELTLARGIVWRWLLELAVRALGPSPRLRADAAFPDPPAFDQPRLRRWRTGR